jgi:hypothetical protein
MVEDCSLSIPMELDPFERGDLYEDPLDRALRKAGKLGRCVGGGTFIPIGSGVRQSSNVDLELTDLAKALTVIAQVLESANAPAGTTLTHGDTQKILLRVTKTGVKQFALPNPKRKKKFADTCPWEPGEVLAYRLGRDRYVLLHVYGFGGLGPLFWVPEWFGKEIPDEATIRALIRKQPELYRLGEVFEAWREKESDRDDRRVIRTGVHVRLPKSGGRGWFAGMMAFQPWTMFESMLKEFFGLKKISPAKRLNHDLGLMTHVVHLAAWVPDTQPTVETARRLFYGCASGYRRTHPDRIKPVVTEYLVRFVAELKSHFAEHPDWLGPFSAKERYVIISVQRRRAGEVWAVVRRLARKHGVTCYHAEKEQLGSRHSPQSGAARP